MTPSDEIDALAERPAEAHLRDASQTLHAPEATAPHSQTEYLEDPRRDRQDDDVEATELHDYSRPTSGIAGSFVRLRVGLAHPDHALRVAQDVPQSEPFPEFNDDAERPVFARLPTTPVQRRKDSWLKRYWRHHIRVAVPHENCRDHLGAQLAGKDRKCQQCILLRHVGCLTAKPCLALERTYLGYVRTSTMLANTGVAVAQLLRLQSDPVAAPGFTLHNLGGGLGVMLIATAIAVIIIGTWRFFKQQMAMTRGKVWAAGWELHSIVWLHIAAVFVLFVVIVAIPYGTE